MKSWRSTIYSNFKKYFEPKFLKTNFQANTIALYTPAVFAIE